MTRFDAARVERMKEAMRPKPASKIVLNLTLEEPWLLEAKEEIMADLFTRLEVYPSGNYTIGVKADRVTRGTAILWQFRHVVLYHSNNLFKQADRWIGQVTKAQGGQVS